MALPARNPERFKQILKSVTSSTPSLTAKDAREAMEHMLDVSSTHPAQIGSFLTALHLTGLEKDPDILAAAALVLREHAVLLELEEHKNQANGGPKVADIVGTGGDGHDTFNVSTTAAIVAAGAGARVYKHGNRASTSSSGSADLLQALGCPLSPPSARTLGGPIDKDQPIFRFLLAPNYHPLLAPLGPIRKLLSHRTLINLLGPLVNPARPSAMILGVAHPSLGPVFAKALSMDDKIERAMVVCGAEGLDEISIAGETDVWEVIRDSEGVKIKDYTINPSLFGVQAWPLEKVKGGNASENAAVFKKLLQEETGEDLRPVLEFVLVNASALLVVSGIANNFLHGVDLARDSISSGKAWKAFDGFRSFDVGL